MIELKKEDLLEVEGGGLGIGLLIVAGIIFLIGVVDGYTRPKACNA